MLPQQHAEGYAALGAFEGIGCGQAVGLIGCVTKSIFWAGALMQEVGGSLRDVDVAPGPARTAPAPSQLVLRRHCLTWNGSPISKKVMDRAGVRTDQLVLLPAPRTPVRP